MQPEDLQGKKVTVLGAARSGRAASRLLAGAGAKVLLSDVRDMPAHEAASLESAEIHLEAGGHSDRALDADLMVISPGVPTSAPVVQRALQRGIPVYSELEAASWFCKARIVAITGTNGKTTTCTLVHSILRSGGLRTVLAGNIGTPFSDEVANLSADSTVILEVSSFQLDHIDSFRPTVSVLLNISPDHLDRYQGSLGDYARAKFRLVENQQEDDVIVYNYDDTRIRKHIDSIVAARSLHAVAFSCGASLSDGISLRDGAITVSARGETEVLVRIGDLGPGGRSNARNAMAAAAAARALEIDNAAIRNSLLQFEGLPHRLEFVRSVDGVRYINDSKATNVNALWYALETMRSPVVLLAGGRDKGNDYSSLHGLVRRKVRAVVAFGESAGVVCRDLGAFAPRVARAATLEEATQVARRLAEPGSVVLLSPACASFDLFDSYEHRGETFKRVVLQF